jgi:hypothetical protein
MNRRRLLSLLPFFVASPALAAGGGYAPAPAHAAAAGDGMRAAISLAWAVVLSVVIVAAVALAALLGAELYVRHTANSIVAKAVSCVVKALVEATPISGPAWV